MLLNGLGIDHTITKTAEGYVVDFCDLCCELRICAVGRFEWEVSAYGIDSYKPSPDYNLVCSFCHSQRKIQIERYAAVSKEIPTDLNQAITETFPNVLEIYGGELAVEKRLRDGIASEFEVVERIHNAIKRADSLYGGLENTNWTVSSSLIFAVLLGAALGVLAYFLAPLFGMNKRDTVALAWFIAPVSAPFIFLALRIWAPYRLKRLARLRLPLIAFILFKIPVSSESINRALEILCTSHCELARWLSKKDILEAINDLRLSCFPKFVER